MAGSELSADLYLDLTLRIFSSKFWASCATSVSAQMPYDFFIMKTFQKKYMQNLSFSISDFVHGAMEITTRFLPGIYEYVKFCQGILSGYIESMISLIEYNYCYCTLWLWNWVKWSFVNNCVWCYIYLHVDVLRNVSSPMYPIACR